jgi:hypothetical protein
MRQNKRNIGEESEHSPTNGERDPQKLASFRDPRCSRSEEEIAKELTGHWREDHLFRF